MAGQNEQELVRDALKSIARPRLTGTSGAAEVEAQLRGGLQAFGYEVRELRFRFSAIPGRFGLPITGALFLAAGSGAVSFLRQGRGSAALLSLSVFLLLATLLAARFPAIIRRLRFGGLDGVNLLAVRPNARPRYIVCAHRDSKSQPLPTIGRAAAAALAILSWCGLFLLSFFATIAPSVHVGTVATVLGIPMFLSGLMLLGCVTGNRSPGALDNASGVAALVGVASREIGNDDVAFLITDAEELGLAGAAAVARQLPPVMGIINIDGLDDSGPFFVVERFGWPRPQGQAPHLAASLLAAAHEQGHEARREDLPFGMLVDHIRFTQAGIPAVTLMRGSRKSLARVHTPGDSLDNLHGTGAAAAVDVISAALARLRSSRPAAAA